MLTPHLATSETPMTRARRAPRTDGDATRLRILDVAGRLFAQSGYAATTSKMVCIEAGVDLASINYHFGNRGGLYEAVLIEGHRRLIDLKTLEALAGSDVPPEDKLGRLIDGLVAQFLLEESWAARVLARELLSPSDHLNALMTHGVEPKLRVGLELLSQITGLPPDDPALLRCLVSVLAPSLALLILGGLEKGVATEVLKMSTDEIANHLKCFAMGGLAAVGAQAQKRGGDH
ncbi:MAG: CerR family C-terminal domain-containing protein [Xanthomonadales bacterium]|nr:CerR family C-terminal domain-containing protein [Xanthomonadales bacterium]